MKKCIPFSIQRARAIATIVMLLLTCVAFPLRATCAPLSPRVVGLALAGGGALGFAHVGVLKVLHEARIPIQIVAGTSMGSIVGAAYASGATLEEIERVLTSTDWDRLFADGPLRADVPLKDKTGRNREILGDGKFGVIKGSVVLPTGILQGQKIRSVLQELYYRYPTSTSFDKLAVRFRAVAADIETGAPVIIEEGDLALAARASMAVPGVFAPVEFNGRLLVDGGIANNLPISTVQELGATHVIAVELYAELQKREKLTNPFAISGQMLSLLLSQNSALQRKLLTPIDILIEPALSGYSSTSFNKAAELVALGEAAARAKLPLLRTFAIPESEYQEFEALRTKKPPTHSIDFITVKNDTSLPDRLIQEKISVKVGDLFSSESIPTSVNDVFNLGSFSSVSTTHIEKEGTHGLEFKVEEKPWYQQYLRVGLGLEDDFRGDNFFNLAAGLRSNDVGLHGGYADLNGRIGRVDMLSAEIVDPISEGSDFFYAFDGFTDRRSLLLRSRNDLIAEYRRTRTQGGVAVGYGFYTSLDARLGFRRGVGSISRRVGSSELPSASFDSGDLFSTLAYDTQDDADFPTSGSLVRIGLSRSLDTLGSTNNFTELSGELSQPIAFGGTSILYRGEFSLTAGERPVGRSFTLGGFLDLSGYTQNSLTATSYHIHRLIVLRELDEGSSLLGYKLFVGASSELSSLVSTIPAIQDRGTISSGSVFLGANTPLLPVYVGVGAAEGGNHSVYLAIGRITSGAQRFDGG